MITGVADTHTALWYLFADPRLSSAAKAFIDRATDARNTVAVASISLAEIVYLVEKRRVPANAFEVLAEALADPEHVFVEASLTTSVVRSMREVSREEVPDLPDRIIAATAVLLGVPILSRDGRIRSARLNTLW